LGTDVGQMRGSRAWNEGWTWIGSLGLGLEWDQRETSAMRVESEPGFALFAR
jgi:hypothetical protein